MKKIFLLISFLLLVSRTCYAQSGWFWLNPLPTGNNLNAIALKNSDSLFVAGDAGTILASGIINSSSTNWQFKENNLSVNNSIKDIKFVNNNYGIAVGGTSVYGNSCFILLTTNGGSSWTNVFNGSGVLFKVFVLDSTLQFAVGDNSLLKSVNKGLTWSNIPLPMSLYARGISFLNNNTGCIAGFYYVSFPPRPKSLVLRTSDGGNIWAIDTLGLGFQVNDLTFLNSKGIITCNNNLLFKSTNSGVNWHYETLNESNVAKSIYLDTNRIFLICSSGKLIRSSNGGLNWIYQSISNFSLNNIVIDNFGTGFLVGDKGTIFKSLNFGIDWMQVSSGIIPYYSIHAFNGVHFTDLSTGTLIGNALEGGIFRTTDGGSSWNLQNDIYWPQGLRLDISYINSTTGFIVGSGIQKTTNAGNNWLYVDVVTPGLKRVQFINSLTGFTVGGPRILKTVNGGVNWQVSYQNAGIILNDISFKGNNGIAVGEGYGGLILVTTNTGQTWVTKNSGLSNYSNFSSVNMINDTISIIAVKDGLLLKTVNAGNNWRTVFSSSTIKLNNICFNGFVNGIVACDEGMILKTTNTGENWTQIQTSSLSNLLKCSTRGENDFVVTGNNLIVLSTSGTSIIGINSSNENIPISYSLSQNYPNPFNPQTKIKFDVPANVRGQTSNVKLVIYDLLGREVATLVNEELKPGTYEADWDASEYSSGIYFYRLISNEFTETRKMVLMK